ncbi:hypothetical protein FB382_002925 [Nocardioides ginsengisegetis]|uniref:Capsular polysaccharide biosynthesis protein n=1 Tax=Nocardioides ginsengisegetis TaxID=661491 RepID=A0A7W3J1S8_9ACTN|nr:hypothetical protein [Nocardioides ginsengisegetis]MBA8804634.1 hypothetical protein [Nocardioides ginsengisegetis]
MTTWDVMRALGRLWFVTFSLLVLVAMAVVHVETRPGIYWAQSKVQFFVSTASAPNRLERSDPDLVATAGLVERLVTGAVRESPSAGSVTLPGQGVRHGSAVVLPNTGGQWASNFSSSVLYIEAVGPSVSDVRKQIEERVRAIVSTLRTLQVGAGVDERNMITVAATPRHPDVQYRGIRTRRAVASSAVLGIGITIFLTVSLDRWLSRRRRLVGLR